MKRAAAYVWRDHREKVLYLVVGLWNTFFQWASFSLFYFLLHDYIFSSWILVITKIFSSTNGFLCYRYIVFGSRGHPLREFLRYQLVWLPIFVINLIALPLALEYTTLNAYVIQAVFAAFSVVVGFVGNNYFTFRKRGAPPTPTSPDGTSDESVSRAAEASGSAAPRTPHSVSQPATSAEGAPTRGTRHL